MAMTLLDLPRAGARKAARRLGLLAATALAAGGVCAPSGAEAQPFWNAMPVTGLYVGAGIGANWVQKTDLEQSGSLTAALRTAGFPAPGGKASFDTGIVALGSLGWGFGNGLRAEAELNYRWNNVDRVTGFGQLGATGRLAGVGGEQQTLGLMFNLLYDFQVPGAPWVVPYLGGGIGMAWTRWSSTEVRSIPADLRIHFGDTQYNFAYQAIAGAAFPIGSVPGLAVTTEFRFFGTLQNKFDASVTRISTGQHSTWPAGTPASAPHLPEGQGAPLALHLVGPIGLPCSAIRTAGAPIAPSSRPRTALGRTWSAVRLANRECALSCGQPSKASGQAACG